MSRAVRRRRWAPRCCAVPHSRQRPRRPLCAGAEGFVCSSVTVPLDRTGTVPGTIRVRFAAQAGCAAEGAAWRSPAARARAAIPFGPGFAEDLRPVLRDHRLVVVDQRGHGRLACPELPGGPGPRARSRRSCPRTSLGCASTTRGSCATASPRSTPSTTRGDPQRSSASRGWPSTASPTGPGSPSSTRAVIPTVSSGWCSDSVVPPDADPWDLRITRRRCRGCCATSAAVASAHASLPTPRPTSPRWSRGSRPSGSLDGVVRDTRGGRRDVRADAVRAAVAARRSDLNPFLQARLPAALTAARDDDLAPLLRLKRDAAGPASAIGELSAGLFVTTTCLDQRCRTPTPTRSTSVPPAPPRRWPRCPGELSRRSTARRSIARARRRSACAGPTACSGRGPPSRCPTFRRSCCRASPTCAHRSRAPGRSPPSFPRPGGAGRGIGPHVLDSDVTGCVDRAIDAVLRRPGGGVAVPRFHRRAARRADAAAAAGRRRTGLGVPGPRGRVLRAAVATVGDASDHRQRVATTPASTTPAAAGCAAGASRSCRPAAATCSSCARWSMSRRDGQRRPWWPRRPVHRPDRRAGAAGALGAAAPGRRAVRGTLGHRRVAASERALVPGHDRRGRGCVTSGRDGEQDRVRLQATSQLPRRPLRAPMPRPRSGE